MQAEPKLQTYLRVTILVSICGAAEKSSLNWLDSAPKSPFSVQTRVLVCFLSHFFNFHSLEASAVPKQVTLLVDEQVHIIVDI